MAKYRIRQGKISGEIIIPPSKSHTLRAILFATLAHGISRIEGYLNSSDTEAMIEACRLLGATIEVENLREGEILHPSVSQNSALQNSALQIHGIGAKLQGAENVIDAGNSGIVLRFCAAIAALSSLPIVITGDHSIRHQRPMQPLLEALSQLGAQAISTKGDGFAPVIISGPLKPGKVVMGGQDSQPVSALLIAAAFAQGEVEIEVREAGEKPWIALTLEWFDRLGICYEMQDYNWYRLYGFARIEGFNYSVPADLSSAAYAVAAALVTSSSVILRGVDFNDVQGDKELFYVLQQMGAQIAIDDEAKILAVLGSDRKRLKGMDVDINRFIDALPILAVIACFAEGKTHIYNGKIARSKECDRIAAIACELKKMGAKVCELEDGLVIEGCPLKGAELFSYRDHRMALSLAVAALGANGESVIVDSECVKKTYPSFVQDFNALGASIDEIQGDENS